MSISLVILGHGKVGKEIERIAINEGIQISGIIDDSYLLKDFEFQKHDIVIDFTNSQAFLSNIEFLMKKKVKVVCGTTGWKKELEYVKNLVLDSSGSFLYSDNFSIGVHIFWNIVAKAAKLINSTDMDVLINEFHHKNKIDWPSGTAIKTGEVVLENFDKKKTLLTEIPHRKLEDDEIFVSCSRGGTFFGEHSVIFDDNDSTIKIEHIAKNRSTFAKGSIDAAKWLFGKKSGFFTFDDMLKDLYGYEY